MRYVIRDHYDCLQKFQGSPSFWFGQIDLLKINDFWKILFSQTLTLMFSYWLIECLQLNQMFVTSFIDFIAKCYWTKLHNMAKIMDFLMDFIVIWLKSWTFWCLTKFSLDHKRNEAWLLVINMVYTSYLKSCCTTSDLGS